MREGSLTGPEIGTPDSQFVRLVHGALTHLYDPASLQNHPLVSMLKLDVSPDHVTRAQSVRRILLECLEMLKPEMRGPERAKAARAYAILTYRYVDGLSIEEIADKLALSLRQTYREHEKGIKAVASLLWDRIQREKGTGHPASETAPVATDRLEAVQAEVNRLRQAGGISEPVNLGEILEGVRTLLTPITRQTGTQIQMPPPDAWPTVIADRVMLRQAFLNLLSHALDRIGGDLTITVLHGPGNPAIHVRADPPRVIRQPPGSEATAQDPDQIALAVARALLEAQGGCLEIRDQGGPWEAQISLSDPGRPIVLVIDDNADIVALFQRYLGGHKVAIVGATDSEHALRLAAELQPQVITLDVMMPQQDGWEILQRLKNSPDTRHIPVVICSVLNEPQLALSMGASAYVTKPISQVALLTTLQRYLGPLQAAG